MLYVPKGQKVIQTWSNFNRNHSSFLGKRRISVGIFQNYKISLPGESMLPLSRFLISFNTNILILKGKYAQLQFLHYCLPKINEVPFSKMDTGEVRWEEHDVNPRKKFLKTNHLPKSLKMETTSNCYFIFFSECFSNRRDRRETFFFHPRRKLAWRSAWRKKMLILEGTWVNPLTSSDGHSGLLLDGWVERDYYELHVDWAEKGCLLESCERGCFPFADLG